MATIKIIIEKDDPEGGRRQLIKNFDVPGDKPAEFTVPAGWAEAPFTVRVYVHEGRKS